MSEPLQLTPDAPEGRAPNPLTEDEKSLLNCMQRVQLRLLVELRGLARHLDSEEPGRAGLAAQVAGGVVGLLNAVTSAVRVTMVDGDQVEHLLPLLRAAADNRELAFSAFGDRCNAIALWVEERAQAAAAARDSVLLRQQLQGATNPSSIFGGIL